MVPVDTANEAMARTYAAAGWRVFPLWWPVDGRCSCPAGKLPADARDLCGVRPDGSTAGSPGKHPLTRNGVKDATADLDTITGWWTRWPHANIGLPAGDNGLAIIDVDPRHGGSESIVQLNAYALTKGVDLTSTLSHFSGGGGVHYLFAAPAGGIKNGQGRTPPFGKDLPGLDTRGRGGYIVAAPSLHVSGDRYAWLDFLADLAPWPSFLTALMEPPKPPRQSYVPAARSGRREGYGGSALRSEVDGVLAATEGNRNNRLHLAAFNLGQLVADGRLDESTVRRELYSAAMCIGLGEAESMKTIDSGLKGGAAKPRIGVA